MSVVTPVYNPVPFAQGGLKNIIPVQPSASEAGRASMEKGFPAETMRAITSGGIPPSGQDVNGILHQLSSHQVFLNAGGLYRFNAAFAADTGGYAAGAVLQLDDGLSAVICTLNNNQNNPNTSTIGWKPYGGKLLEDRIAALETVPVLPAVISGSIMMWAMSSIPAGYLECAGQEVSRTGYNDLFAVLGTAYGTGNGSTTFNVPDLRGEFVRGWDHGRAVDNGRGLGTTQLDQMQRITGSYEPYHNSWGSGVTGAFGKEGPTRGGTGEDYIPGQALKFDSANSPGARVGEETRPRNIALIYIIKI